MQLNFRLMPVLALAVITSFSACKKETSSSSTTDPAPELAAQADDQSQVSAQVDVIANDANGVLESSASFSGRMQTPPVVICDATVVYDSVSNPRTITITYNGDTCHRSYTRTGTVVLSMPQSVRWKDAGAAVTVKYQNLKITRTADGKSVTINGSHTFTNVSGGLLVNLASLQSITHTISGSMTLSFDNNTQRSWQVERKRVYTYNNGIVITISGNGTDGSTTGIAEWGTNRFGHAFKTIITQPLVIRQDCDFRLTAGEIKHEGVATATATFGLDANGNPTSCPAGRYYFKLVWTGPNGTTKTTILPY